LKEGKQAGKALTKDNGNEGKDTEKVSFKLKAVMTK
jgi:hypothetical protein